MAKKTEKLEDPRKWVKNLDIESTTSAAEVRVKDTTGKIALFGVDNTAYGYVKGDTGVGLKFLTNGNNTRMTISGSGVVGIGTTTPSGSGVHIKTGLAVKVDSYIYGGHLNKA